MDYKAVMMEAALLHTACDHTHVVRLLAVVDDRYVANRPEGMNIGPVGSLLHSQQLCRTFHSVPIGLVLELADLGDLRSYLRQQAGSLSDDAKVL